MGNDRCPTALRYIKEMFRGISVKEGPSILGPRLLVVERPREKEEARCPFVGNVRSVIFSAYIPPPYIRFEVGTSILGGLLRLDWHHDHGTCTLSQALARGAAGRGKAGARRVEHMGRWKEMYDEERGAAFYYNKVCATQTSPTSR